MKRIALPAFIALLCLHGCAEMPAYSNVAGSEVTDESRYTVVETDTYAGRPQRHYADLQPDLNIIKVNDKKVGNIPFSTYYYKNDSPQRAVLTPASTRCNWSTGCLGTSCLRILSSRVRPARRSSPAPSTLASTGWKYGWKIRRPAKSSVSGCADRNRKG